MREVSPTPSPALPDLSGAEVRAPSTFTYASSLKRLDGVELTVCQRAHEVWLLANRLARRGGAAAGVTDPLRRGRQSSAGSAGSQLLPSLISLQGIGFQLWPAAHAVGSYIEECEASTPNFWQVRSPRARRPGALRVPRDAPRMSRARAVTAAAPAARGVQGKEVLELGAGVGLTAVLLAALGARVTLTDLPDVVVRI